MNTLRPPVEMSLVRNAPPARAYPRFPCVSFVSRAEFDNYVAESRPRHDALFLHHRDFATSEPEIRFAGTCGPCMRPVTFTSGVAGGEQLPDGRVVPNWREETACDCDEQLRARFRASLHFLLSVTGISKQSRVVSFGPPTQLMRRLSTVAPKTTSVSRLAVEAGVYRIPEASNSSHVVVALDALQQVPPLEAALAEIHRVLVRGGHFVFTVPFRLFTAATVSHLAGLPRVHGRLPVEAGHEVHEIGWDILDRLRDAGFRRSAVHVYWSEELGYLGMFNTIFSAEA